MFCINCGKEVVNGASFCMYCGTKVPAENVSIETFAEEKSMEISGDDSARNETSETTGKEELYVSFLTYCGNERRDYKEKRMCDTEVLWREMRELLMSSQTKEMFKQIYVEF